MRPETVTAAVVQDKPAPERHNTTMVPNAPGGAAFIRPETAIAPMEQTHVAPVLPETAMVQGGDRQLLVPHPQSGGGIGNNSNNKQEQPHYMNTDNIVTTAEEVSTIE